MSKTVQGRNGAHSKASKRRKKQKNRLIIVVIEILVLLILAAVLFVTVKLSKIQKDTSFNKEDIEVNEGLSSESQEIMQVIQQSHCLVLITVQTVISPKVTVMLS